jgi:glycosyltransferase involved in cell wall biosynthesis
VGGGLDAVDEVWMNSEFAAKGVRKVTAKPVRVLPLPVRLPVPSATDRSTLGLPDGFLFLFVFSYASSFERKNPDGLVRAFKQAFAPGEGPLAVAKSVMGDAHSDERERLRYEAGDRPDILLLENYLLPGDKNALMAACDCYISLHRSEGFGLTMAEAMALGKPTIATGYSGNLEFMTSENSFLVGFGEGRVPPQTGRYPSGALWADPDLNEAAALMRRVCEDPEEARRVGERVRADMARLHGPEARARLLQQLLEQARSEWRQRQPAERAGTPLGLPGPGRGQPPCRPAAEPVVAKAAVGRQVVVDPERHEELWRAKRELLWLLRRLEKPPLGWLLSRRKGYRRLRDRWLGGG